MNKHFDEPVKCAACGKIYHTLVCPVCGSVVCIPINSK